MRRGISDEQNVLDLAMKREGIVDGVVIPLFVGHGLLGMMLLGGEMHGRLNDGICFLRLLSVFFCDRLCAMRRDVLREEYGLSAREFECMKWVAAGKTDWETGQILSISPKTVNYHVENAKRKFGVSTRLQGVVAAILSGAVEP